MPSRASNRGRSVDTSGSIRKRIKRQGLEAFQSEPDSTHFGTGNQVQEKGRKSDVPSHSGRVIRRHFDCT